MQRLLKGHARLVLGSLRPVLHISEIVFVPSETLFRPDRRNLAEKLLV